MGKVQAHPLDALFDELADRIAERVVARMGGASKGRRYATAKDNPIYTERGFLDAARRGDFPSFKRGRTVAALWEDVERYVEGKRLPARAREDDLDGDRALLAQGGVRLRRSRGR